MIRETEVSETENDPDETKAELILVGPNFFRIGLWMTILYSLIVGAYCTGVWDRILTMEPNEFGDFLAGVLGPLALAWIVLGFLQQGQELRFSRDALLLQARELRHSVLHQSEIADAAREANNIEKARMAQDSKDRIDDMIFGRFSR
jgi:hypothetical protein